MKTRKKLTVKEAAKLDSFEVGRRILEHSMEGYARVPEVDLSNWPFPAMIVTRDSPWWPKDSRHEHLTLRAVVWNPHVGAWTYLTAEREVDLETDAKSNGSYRLFVLRELQQAVLLHFMENTIHKEPNGADK